MSQTTLAFFIAKKLFYYIQPSICTKYVHTKGKKTQNIWGINTIIKIIATVDIANKTACLRLKVVIFSIIVFFIGFLYRIFCAKLTTHSD